MKSREEILKLIKDLEEAQVAARDAAQAQLDAVIRDLNARLQTLAWLLDVPASDLPAGGGDDADKRVIQFPEGGQRE